MTETQAPSSNNPKSDHLGLYVGGGTLVFITGMYIFAQNHRADGRPAGHPAVGIIWLLISFMTLRSALRAKPAPRIMYWITLGLVVIGGAIWLAATLQPPLPPMPAK